MYRTVRSANPTYREHESTRIDQVVDPIACDSETPVWDSNTCMGLKHLSGTQTPRIRVPNRTHNKPILQSIKPKHLLYLQSPLLSGFTITSCCVRHWVNHSAFLATHTHNWPIVNEHPSAIEDWSGNGLIKRTQFAAVVTHLSRQYVKKMAENKNLINHIFINIDHAITFIS
jgi:hypothetical protein